MTCKYCDDSHSAFDPCPESIAAMTHFEPAATPGVEIAEHLRQLILHPDATVRNSATAILAALASMQASGELPPLPKPDRPNIWGGCYSPEATRAYGKARRGQK